MEILTLTVKSMNCAEAAGSLQANVGKLSGIHRLNVNVLTGTMCITFNERRLSDRQIIAAVEADGFKAQFYQPDDVS